MGTKTLREIVMFGVPAIIALMMVGAAIYLAIWTDKEIPGFLVNSLGTILGYYFGLGVKAGLEGKSDGENG